MLLSLLLCVAGIINISSANEPRKGLPQTNHEPGKVFSQPNPELSNRKRIRRARPISKERLPPNFSTYYNIEQYNSLRQMSHSQHMNASTALHTKGPNYTPNYQVQINHMHNASSKGHWISYGHNSTKHYYPSSGSYFQYYVSASSFITDHIASTRPPELTIYCYVCWVL